MITESYFIFLNDDNKDKNYQKNHKNEPEVEFLLVLPPNIQENAFEIKLEPTEEYVVNLMRPKWLWRPKMFKEVFICSKCNVTTSSPKLLKMHSRVCGRRFECNVCSAKFSVKSTLLEHLIVHFQLKFFFCADCGEGFRMQSAYENHMNRVKFLKCSQCEK